MGIAAQGQVVGFFNDTEISEIRIEYFDTQAIGINESGDLLGRRASEGEDAPLRKAGYVKSTVSQTSNNETIKIKSLGEASLGIKTFGIVYSSNL